MSGSIGSKAQQGPGSVIMMITRRKSRVVPKNGRLLKRLLGGRVETVGACIGGFDKHALDVRHKPKAIRLKSYARSTLLCLLISVSYRSFF